jgi:hypothetical protein
MDIRQRIGQWLARYLSQPRRSTGNIATCTPAELQRTLRKGDVLLVDGNSRFSTAIKYVTQSTWSHSSLYAGDGFGLKADNGEPAVLLEADVSEGVRAIPLSCYSHMHTRICRPIGLEEDEINQVIRFIIDRIGHQYDLKNVFDLVRYLVQTPPVPTRWRRHLIALGSGDPTKAICSSLIAGAFQSVAYPILPNVSVELACDPGQVCYYQQVMHIRHHSLYAPRDFDASPYFQVVKPTIEQGFDPHSLHWSQEKDPSDPVKGQSGGPL